MDVKIANLAGHEPFLSLSNIKFLYDWRTERQPYVIFAYGNENNTTILKQLTV